MEEQERILKATLACCTEQVGGERCRHSSQMADGGGHATVCPWKRRRTEGGTLGAVETPTSQVEPEMRDGLPIRAAMNAVGTSATGAATSVAFLLGLASCMAASNPMQVRHARESPPLRDCPYAIPTQEEAFSRGHDPSIPGNALWVDDIEYGRMGNRIVGLGNILKLGACCKSKMVALPPKDCTMVPSIFNEGNPGPRWFDFSHAPDFKGFNSSTCPTNMTWHKDNALHLTGLDDEDHQNYTPGLTRCINNSPRQAGCEATYIFPTDINLCDFNEFDNVDRREEEVEDAPKIEFQTSQDDGDKEQEQEQDRTNGTAVSGGNLAIHVRSGDIFVRPVHHWYGQPPLQYYLRVLEEEQWSRVDFLTSGVNDSKHKINPVLPVLESKVADGDLIGNIHFHENRTMGEDLVSMLCSDGLALANSTLTRAWAYHATATRIYFPFGCSGYLHDLVDQRPEIQVYGMMSSPSLDDYSPYHEWNMTEHQLEQMMTFNITGFEECQGTSSSTA